MNNHKNSKLLLWMGILIGVISTIFLFLYQLANKNKTSISTVVDKYIKISPEKNSTELVKVENQQTKGAQVKDNLKEIKGIGPAIETLLNNNNIFTFSDLSSKSVEDLEIILVKKNWRLANPQTWPAQALQAAKNKIKSV